MADVLTRCGYGGHSSMDSHDGPYLMRSPPDKLHRVRTVWCCIQAKYYAEARGYTEVVG